MTTKPEGSDWSREVPAEGPENGGGREDGGGRFWDSRWMPLTSRCPEVTARPLNLFERNGAAR